ncbi:MAG: hypothetical protein ABR555_15500, partial [Pyrinomonadaceae bacterium]
CFDHPSAKASVSFTITAPAQENVTANGELLKVEDDIPGYRTWTYNEAAPIPPYCMIIAIGEFAKLQPERPAIVPLGYYVPHSDSTHAVSGFTPA